MSDAPSSAGAAAEPPLSANPVRFALELVCAALLALLFLLLLGTSALRNQGYTAPGVYEFIRVTFVYLIGLSAIVAYLRGANLRVPGWWPEDSVTYQAILLLLSLCLTFLSVQMLLRQGFGNDASSLLGLPEGISHIPIGLFGLGLSLVCARRLRVAIRRKLA